MSELNSPYWLKLINAWCAAGRTGLSIPFLVGAKTLTEEGFEPGVEDIVDLLKEVFACDLPDGFIRIRWCSEVRAFVIGICREIDLEEGIVMGKVHISREVFHEFDGNSQEHIIYGLTKEYLPEVAEGSFSVHKGQWDEFTARDKKFIADALA